MIVLGAAWNGCQTSLFLGQKLKGCVCVCVSLHIRVCVGGVGGCSHRHDHWSCYWAAASQHIRRENTHTVWTPNTSLVPCLFQGGFSCRLYVSFSTFSCEASIHSPLFYFQIPKKPIFGIFMWPHNHKYKPQHWNGMILIIWRSSRTRALVSPFSKVSGHKYFRHHGPLFSTIFNSTTVAWKQP